MDTEVFPHNNIFLAFPNYDVLTENPCRKDVVISLQMGDRCDCVPVIYQNRVVNHPIPSTYPKHQS
jgi:hypothetical protein